MTSRGLIMIVCWAIVMVDLFTETWAADPLTPMAFIISFLIMEWTGMFKKEVARYNEAKEGPKEQLSERQIDFMRKLEEGKLDIPDFDEEELQARIITVDEDGNQSSVIIKPDGTVETEGDPDPDIVKAARMMKDVIKEYGPDGIAEELRKQIEKIKNEEK